MSKSTYVLVCSSLLILAGCARPQEIQKETLIEKTHHWREPKVAIWHYTGTTGGRDVFDYRDLDIHEVYSVESGQIALPRSFPITKDESMWFVMAWGPLASKTK
jgi:hypothetical protein